VLHFTFTEIVQERSPPAIVFEIIGDMSRYKDVTGIAAIHDPLRDVNAGAGDIEAAAHIAHRSAVNSHSHCDLGTRP
jgi:hypothetical protein